jgi:hypothetical protein
MLLEMSFDSVQHGIALFLRKRPPKEFHHTSASIHMGERLPVGVAPRAEREALGGDSHLVHDAHIKSGKSSNLMGGQREVRNPRNRHTHL